MARNWMLKTGAYTGMVLALCLGAYPGFAQGDPTSCIAEINKEFGSNAALNTDCSGKTDCSFLAKLGNAQARNVIASIVRKAESCFKAAGQSVIDEQTQDGSTMRQFDGNGETRCAILISKSGSDTPEGVRVICQQK